MPYFTRKVQASAKKFNIKQGLSFIAIICVFFSAIYLGTLFLTPSSDSPKPSEKYTVLTLALYQSATYTQEYNTYEFSYVPGGEGNLLHVFSEGQSVNYAAVPGTTPNPFGLKVTIYSANEKMLVIHIMPLETIND